MNGVEMERAVLATAMLRPSSLHDLKLQAKHFADERHGEVWETIQSMSVDGKPIEAVAVMESLERQGRHAVASLALALASEEHPVTKPGYYAGRILDAWRTREAIQIGQRLIDAVKKNGSAAADEAIGALMALHETDRDHESTAKMALAAAWKEIEAAYQAGGRIVGIPTGIARLDDSLGGYHNGDLIVVGARPGVGKTAFLLQSVIAGTANNVPAGLFSLEQPDEQVGLRWMASHSSVSLGKLRAGKIDDDSWPSITRAITGLQDRPIRIYDQPAASLPEIVRVARRWKHQFGIRAIYLDYLQRVQYPGNAPKHERVGMVAMGLKNLARDLDIPVIALAQVKREVDDRADKRPGMSDLADSSDIEKEADQIMTLWRDDAKDDEAQPAEINVVKNRHGNRGKVHCYWNGSSTTYTDRKPSNDPWQGAEAA